jgi:hypothetical protein
VDLLATEAAQAAACESDRIYIEPRPLSFFEGFTTTTTTSIASSSTDLFRTAARRLAVHGWNNHGDHSPMYEAIEPFGVVPDGTSSTDDPVEVRLRVLPSSFFLLPSSFFLLPSS